MRESIKKTVLGYYREHPDAAEFPSDVAHALGLDAALRQAEPLLHPQPRINVWREAHGMPPVFGGHRTVADHVEAFKGIPFCTTWWSAALAGEILLGAGRGSLARSVQHPEP